MLIVTVLLCVSTIFAKPQQHANAKEYQFTEGFGDINAGKHVVKLNIIRRDNTYDYITFTVGAETINEAVRFPNSLNKNVTPYEINYINSTLVNEISLDYKKILSALKDNFLIKDCYNYRITERRIDAKFVNGRKFAGNFKKVDTKDGVVNLREYNLFCDCSYLNNELIAIDSEPTGLYNGYQNIHEAYAIYNYDKLNNISFKFSENSNTEKYILTFTLKEYFDPPIEIKSESDLKNSVYGLSELFPDFDTNSWVDWYCAYLNENGIKSAQELTAPYTYQNIVGRKWNWKTWKFDNVYQTVTEPKGERQMYKYYEQIFGAQFQMLFAANNKDVQRYITNKQSSYTAFSDKYDELIPKKLVDKQEINLNVNVNVKGANYSTEKVISIPSLKIYRLLGNNDDNRYYRLYFSHNDLDYLINDLSLRVVDLTHDSFGAENKIFEEDTYITDYYKKVNAENGEVILNELISWCIPISKDTYDKASNSGTTIPTFTINAVCEANAEHKSNLPDYSIASGNIQNYVKNAAIRVFVAEDTVNNNMSTAEINSSIVVGEEPPRYEMMMFMPATYINDTLIAGIEKVYLENYGGSCKFVGLSEKRNSTELITTPTTITTKDPVKTLYVVTEKNQSKIIVQTNKTSSVMYIDYNAKLDKEMLPKTLAFQGKTYEIIGWTEERVLYPWDLGYGPGKTYNTIDFETWTATKSQHYLSPILNKDLEPVEIVDPEPLPEVKPGDDTIISGIKSGWDNFIKDANKFFNDMFGIVGDSSAGFVKFIIIIGSVLGGLVLLGLFVRVIKWIKR